ncbi:hypothetical protein N9C53_00230 [bacterium]|nr:hypothetical protein [bacterium]
MSFLKKAFKYISLSALGLVVVAGLFGFLTYQYDEYMARVDEKTMFECTLPDDDSKGWWIVLESSKQSRKKSWYYDGVNVIDELTVPNTDETYMAWDSNYSAARTAYEIYIVNSLYQALKLLENPDDPDVKKFITIDRTTLKAKRFSGYKRSEVTELQCKLHSDEKRIEIEKAVYESEQKTLANRKV